MKFKLGRLIEQLDERNAGAEHTLTDVKGISIQKVFIETKANMDGVSLKPYKLVKPDTFAYVTVTSRNGEKITLAYNDTEDTYIVSSSYIVFHNKEPKLLSSEFLFMYFNRPEFDRFSRYNSWGSARETFSWDDMCDIEIDLPPLHIQEKYVAVYQAMLANQKAYENGLEDLKLVCDATIEKLRREMPSEAIGRYIEQTDERNDGLGVDFVRGLSIEKKIIPTKANMSGVSLSNYKLFKPNEIAYVTVTSRNGEKITIAQNNTTEKYLVSSSYITFKITDKEILLPEFLFMYFNRDNFDRFARFNSWGSARETYNWEDFIEFEIPVPDINIQQSIVDIYNAYITRKEINERLKQQIKEICPILIAGAIKEANSNA
ncbi:restriction endonuclease subunit S [Streptococcus suis]|uniref:Type I restriction modification DNA specificity domain n=1 Tax=Streptococcus suis TaxID=1307 RepID=A0A0Z8MMZ5_STRSU|nr:restriction endonuclease subunit S [Streptococcus suis]NQG45118.1 restriction endonuclease subunit S [Streptococcus suis]NQH52387.1 restriction endonuclease subunit S [Streptococcus suis]CYV10971.1 Type I restriction modification DNA specificity domain [Streptococcus suis]CYW12021.1 Type I restriction modification DNA specificity domain [Streptococcus suis]